MHSEIFSLGGLFLFVTCFIFNIIILCSRRSKLLWVCALFNLAVGVWGFFAFLIGRTESPEHSIILWRLAHIGITLIAVFVFHLILLFCDIQKKVMLRLAYAQALIFIILSLSNHPSFFKALRPFFGFWYPKGGWAYFIFFGIWAGLVFYSHYLLFSIYKNSHGIKRTQIKYFFFGILFGFSGGITNFLPVLGINVFPFGNFTIPIYSLVLTYAILKYRLLDIKIAFTRTGIFVFVYSLVLGIPFAIALTGREMLIELMGSNWWMVPLATSTFLATGGPFIYLYLQRKAEEKLLYEQRRYQATLRQASAGMSRIKDLKRLLNLIVYILSRTVNLEYCTIYLYDPNNREYSLEAFRGKKTGKDNHFIDEQSPIVKHLKKMGSSIVYEEIYHKNIDFKDAGLENIEAQMKVLEAEVVVPIATDKALVAFGVLGRKRSGQMYTSDDLAVFSILGTQVALAIENAQFYEESKTTQAQLFQAEKMATIGTMADGLSHQINNRLHALGFIAGDALDSIKLKSGDAELAPEEIRDLLRDVVAALLKIQDNVRQGGEIVQGLLRYTRKGEEGYGPVDFDKLMEASVEMAQFKIKKDQLTIIKDYPRIIPEIYGNFTQLQEVMFNIIDNAYDAVQQKKAEAVEENYQGKIKVSTRCLDGFLEINFLDNGIGIKDEDQMKLFTPFFTTKLSSKKGTGLGLYVIRKIIEENHHGRVFMTSEYGVGTLTLLKLPIVKKKD